MPRYLHIFLMFFLATNIFANENIEYYTAKHIGTEQGLPHNLVFDIAQCSDGFIWFATNNGLGRYDGYSFKTFRPNGKKNSISNKSISKIFIDNSHNMWLSINGIGINKMNMADHSFTYFLPNQAKTNSIKGNNAVAYYQSSDSNIWISTNRGLNLYSAENDTFENYLPDSIKYYYSEIEKDNNNNLWIRANNNILFFNTTTHEYKLIYDIAPTPKLKNLIITDFLLINNSILAIGTPDRGLIFFDTKTNKVIKHLKDVYSANNLYFSKKGDLYFISYTNTAHLNVIPKFTTESMSHKTIAEFPNSYLFPAGKYCEDSKNNIWISSGGNIYKIYPNHTVSTIKNKKSNGHNIISKNIITSFIDNADNLWLKTHRNGAIMINLNQAKFETYLGFNNEIISDRNISMVYVDYHENVWVGSYNKGVTCYNPENKTFINFKHKPDGDNSKFLIYKAPAGICEDNSGNVWVGFYEGNTVMINPKTKKINTFKFSDSTYNEYNNMHSIRRIIPDGDKLWFGASSVGLVEYKKSTNQYYYHSVNHEKDYNHNSHYRFLIKTSDGNFWSGSQNGGLSCYNPQTHNFVRYKHIPENQKSISSNTVYFIHEQCDSILWIGTAKGLNKFNRYSETFYKIGENIENTAYSVCRIYPDNYNNLWLSGDSGLKKFNLETSKFTTYNESDGLPTKQFNTTAGCKARNDKIYLGTSNGLISFTPNEIKPNPYTAKPKLTALKLFNKEIAPYDSIKGYVVLTKTIEHTKELTLPYYLNDFTLEFSAMHFAAPEKNMYKYKLEGFNEEWITTTANRRWANFTGLKPGNYKFHLKATNNDGTINDETDTVKIDIIITPPFTSTWFFRLIIILAVALIGYTLSRIRIKTIKNQNIRLERIVQSRTEELESQNELLEERQEEISYQKDELERHRNHLEELVTERTSELETALKKAEESEKLKSAFLSNMSHEIRTPMNAILGFSSLMKDDDFSMEEMKKFTETIHNNAATLLNLLNDIIDVSIIEAGELNIIKENVAINDIVKDVISVFAKDNICISNPDIIITHKEKSIESCTDPNRLKQILNNLIGNSIKFTKCGQIDISYEEKGETILFAINDTGIGINNEKLKFIFDRFNKIENINNEIYKGGGLGLSISKRLSEALGGKIWAESKLDKGSTFFFTINKQ